MVLAASGWLVIVELPFVLWFSREKGSRSESPQNKETPILRATLLDPKGLINPLLSGL